MNSGQTPDKKIKELEEDLKKLTLELSNAYEEISLIYNITNDMGTLLDPESLSIRVLDKAIELLGARVGFLMLFEEGNKRLKIRASRGFGPEESERFDKYNPLKGVAAMAISKGRPIVWCDVSQQEEAFLGIKSCLAVPIRVKEEKIGLILLGDKESGESFYSYEEKLLFTPAILGE